MSRPSIVNMAILNTKIDIYKHRQDGRNIRLIEILRFMYKEMKADEYDYEVNQKMNNFENICLKVSIFVYDVERKPFLNPRI